MRKNIAAATRGQAEPAREKNTEKKEPLNQTAKGSRGAPKDLAETKGHHMRNLRSKVIKHTPRLRLPQPKTGVLDFFHGPHHKSKALPSTTDAKL